jgi:hypothetical protein
MAMGRLTMARAKACLLAAAGQVVERAEDGEAAGGAGLLAIDEDAADRLGASGAQGEEVAGGVEPSPPCR